MSCECIDSPKAPSYADWKAPDDDLGLLIWPDPAAIISAARQNRESLEADDLALIQNVPAAELRRRQREMLDLGGDAPAIVVGHQVELYHPGVWAKLALADAAAKQVNGRAVLLAVDTDAPKHLNLRYPGGDLPITDDPRLATAAWTGLLASPSRAHLAEISNRFSQAAGNWPFHPVVNEFLVALAEESERPSISPSPGTPGEGWGGGPFDRTPREEPPPSPSPGVPGEGKIAPLLAASLVAAMRRLDERLGLRHTILPASPLWSSDPYLVLTHHILARADEFAAVYNQALAEYRAEHRLRTAARPMPDLQVSPEDCEVPFWLDDLQTGTRERATVRRDGDGWSLNAGNERFAFDQTIDGWIATRKLAVFCRRQNIRLSPRALTLTLFIRLLVADQFVHGIGGGRYDQVTDRVMQRFLEISPPAFCVTTATLHFPTSAGLTRPDIPRLLHEGSQLRHRVLGQRKMEMVERISRSPRGSPERQQLFSRMHADLVAAQPANQDLRAWQARLTDAQCRIKEDAPLYDRELFYAIQPAERLQSLLHRYRDAFEGLA